MYAARLGLGPLKILENLERRLLFAAGDLDSLFAGGKVIRDLLGGDDFGFAVVVQADGKVLVAGRAQSGGVTGNDFAVARFNADGSVDGGFGTGGIVSTDLGSASDSAYAMVVQGDGKIVVAGETARSASAVDFAIVRYNPDGTLDNSFGSAGKVVTDFSGSTDQALGVALTADGRIVAAGWATVAGLPRFALARYASDGVLDPTFGSGGRITTTFASGSSRGQSVVVLPDGSIVVAGSAVDFAGTGAGDFAAVRYLGNGQVDATFGTGGWATIDMGGDEIAHALLVQSDGKLVLAGEYNNWDTGAGDFALARLTAGGALDGSFGAGGAVPTDFAGDYDQGTSAAIQSDGKIVIGGIATVDGNLCFGLARYDTTGNLDTSFAGSGKMTIQFGSSDVANGVALDSQGRIVAGGFSMDSSGAYDFAAARVIGQVNVAPTANPGSGYSVRAGSSVQLDGSASIDPDGSIVSYEWDFNYDGVTFDVDAAGATPAFSAAGLTGPAVRTIALRVTDNAGATHIATTTVSIQAAIVRPPTRLPQRVTLEPDVANAARTILTVSGTARCDRIVFRSVKDAVEVRMNGELLGRFSNVSRIVAYGDAGNDLIDARRSPVPVDLFGGKGCDILLGSRLDDILSGGEGNDHLFGFKGNDLIVGGMGRDDLHSRFGNDKLVAGAMAIEENVDQLRALLGSSSIEPASVIDDHVRDWLHGTPGADCLVGGQGDKIHRIRK